MNCDAALMEILVADLDHLMPGSDSTLALHLADCSRCRRVATRLRADNAALADLLAEQRPKVIVSSRNRIGWVIGASLAAAALFLALRVEPTTPMVPSVASESVEHAIAPQVQAPTSPVPSVVAKPVIRRPEPLAAIPDARLMTAVEVVHPGTVRANTFSAPTPVTAVAFEPPTAISPKSLTPRASLATSAGQSPDTDSLPTSSLDRTVLPSGDPSITVIWFN